MYCTRVFEILRHPEDTRDFPQLTVEIIGLSISIWNRITVWGLTYQPDEGMKEERAKRFSLNEFCEIHTCIMYNTISRVE